MDELIIKGSKPIGLSIQVTLNNYMLFSCIGSPKKVWNLYEIFMNDFGFSDEDLKFLETRIQEAPKFTDR